MNVAIATCRAYPTLLRFDLLYEQALIDLKVNVAVLPWNAADLDAFLEQDMIVLRATWDYQDDPERYTAWLQTLAAKRAKIMNPPELAIWNNDKRHLIELTNAGYLTAETIDLRILH